MTHLHFYLFSILSISEVIVTSFELQRITSTFNVRRYYSRQDRYSRFGSVQGVGAVSDVLCAVEHPERQTSQEVPRREVACHGPQLEAGLLCRANSGSDVPVLSAEQTQGQMCRSSLPSELRVRCAGPLCRANSGSDVPVLSAERTQGQMCRSYLPSELRVRCACSLCGANSGSDVPVLSAEPNSGSDVPVLPAERTQGQMCRSSLRSELRVRCAGPTCGANSGSDVPVLSAERTQGQMRWSSLWSRTQGQMCRSYLRSELRVRCAGPICGANSGSDMAIIQAQVVTPLLSRRLSNATVKQDGKSREMKRKAKFVERSMLSKALKKQTQSLVLYSTRISLPEKSSPFALSEKNITCSKSASSKNVRSVINLHIYSPKSITTLTLSSTINHDVA